MINQLINLDYRSNRQDENGGGNYQRNNPFDSSSNQNNRNNSFENPPQSNQRGGGYENQQNSRGGYDNQQNKRGGFESRQNGQNSRGRFDSHHQNDRQTDNFNNRGGYQNRQNGSFDNRENSNSNFDNRQNGRGGGGGGSYNRGGGNNSYNRDGPQQNYRQNEKNNFYESQNEPETTPYEHKSEIIDWDKINERCDLAQKERWAKCPPLVKNFYNENDLVRNLTEEQVALFREENNNIVVNRCFGEISESDPIPNPVLTFDHCFHDYPDLMGEIEKVGFKKPSPIQSQAWPVLMKGEDLIGIAQTGTGKTLAFLLPGMIHTELQPTPRGTRGGPNVLVMAPTRELALQIEKEVGKYHFRGMKA